MAVTITGGWRLAATSTPTAWGTAPTYHFYNGLSPISDATLLVAIDSPSGAPVSQAKTVIPPPPGQNNWWWGPYMDSGIYGNLGQYDPVIAFTRPLEDQDLETNIFIDGINYDDTNTDITGTDPPPPLGSYDGLGGIFGGLSGGGTITTCGEMNPAHIIRECLTDQQWGLGLPEADVDETTFLAAAQTLYNEGFGLSLAWSRQQPIEDFINVILNHIDAVLYVNRTEGAWVLKLIRNDYDENTLVEYTDADVVEWNSIAIKGPAELTNSVTINYNSRELRGEASLTVNNLAQIQQLGSVINTTVTYPGIWQKELATRVAQRDLASLSTALIVGDVSLTRKAYNLNPGDVVKLTSARYNLSGEIMRIAEVDLGDGLNNVVRIKFTQDKFNLDSSTDTDIVDVPDVITNLPTTIPQPIEYRKVMEYPHYLFSRLLGDVEADARETAEPDLGYLSYTGIPPSIDSRNAVPFLDDGSGYEQSYPRLVFGSYATVDTELREYGDATTLSVTGWTYYTDVSVGDLLIINDEIMKVDALVSATEITVGRGCLDTVPQFHKSGSKVIFIKTSLAVNPKEYVASDVLNLKLLTVSGQGRLQQALAPVDIYTMDSRITRPYPVGKLQLDGAYSSVWDTASGATTTATWVHRDRLLQTGDDVVDFTDASIGPEASSDYTISAVAYDLLGNEIYPELFSTNKAQLLTHTITSGDYSPTTEGTDPWSAVGVRVTNTRGAYDNYQTPEVLSYYPLTPTETEGFFIGIWIDVNDIASLTQDPEGTTPVVYDGDPVGGITSQRNYT